jgi:hypothetical protein
MIRRPAVNRLDAEAVPPGCVCDAQQAERLRALADIRAMAIRECGQAGSNRQLIDFALDIVNRTKGL